MSKYEKLLEKIQSLDKGLRFDQLEKVLVRLGYKPENPGSSHVTFRKDGRASITIPMHEPIKQVYVKMVRAILKQEGII